MDAEKVLGFNMSIKWKLEKLPIIPDRINYNSYWEGSDTKELYEKNKPHGYTETSITYKYNQYGFRTQDYDLQSTKPSILCLGCSFTSGTGINIEEVWPSHIQQAFPDHNVYNLGVSYGSGDTITRLLYNIGGVLNTTKVLILWPEVSRYEIYNEYGVKHVSAMDAGAYTSETLNEIHFRNLREKNRAIISLLKEKYNYVVCEHTTREIPSIPTELARDGHAGPTAQRMIAELFLNQLNNNNV